MRRAIILTLSGSSAHTLRPGFALSGSTHSFEGFANTFPADEDVSFPGSLTNGAEMEVTVEVEAELGARKAIVGRAGIAILPLELESE